MLLEDIQDHPLQDNVIKMYVKNYTYLKKDCALFMKRLKYRLAQEKLDREANENTPLLGNI